MLGLSADVIKRLSKLVIQILCVWRWSISLFPKKTASRTCYQLVIIFFILMTCIFDQVMIFLKFFFYFYFFNIFIETQDTNKKKYIKIVSIQSKKKTIYVAYNVQVKLRYKVYELLYF